MKSWIFAMMVVAAGSLVACSSSDGSGGSGGGDGGSGGGDGGSGAAGGSGGSGGNTGTTASTTGTGTTGTTTGTTSTTSTTSPPTGCDDTGVCQDMDDDTTNDCVSCAFQDPCFDQVQECGSTPDCCTPQADGSCGTDSFVGCIGECADNDQACFDDCVANHMTGAQVYNGLILCVICDNCYNDCDGATAGCP